MILRNNLHRLTSRLLLAVSVIALLFAVSHPVFAAPTVTLGSAANFAVLGASTVTNTGPTIITGDLGVSPGTAITGFPPGTLIGTQHAGPGDAIATQAQADLTTAYNALVAMQCGTNLTGKILGTDVTTLSPGVYCFDSSAQLTGTLHLNGPADGVYIFKIGSTLTTASNSFVIVDNNNCGGNVFWQITSSATLGTGTTFAGNIVALTSITITTSTTISGRALARNGAVTMDTNNISACGAGVSEQPIEVGSFTINSTNVKAGDTVKFTATITGGTGPFTCTFNFGDKTHVKSTGDSDDKGKSHNGDIKDNENGDDSHNPTGDHWNNGEDRTTSTSSSVTVNADGRTCTTTHTYLNSGTFKATVTVKGSSSATDTESMRVHVKANSTQGGTDHEGTGDKDNGNGGLHDSDKGEHGNKGEHNEKSGESGSKEGSSCKGRPNWD